MNRQRYRAVLAACAAAAALVLVGCSAPGPARDANGRVLETLVVDSTTMLVGDCFTIPNANDLSEVKVTPCIQRHTHIVIGQGELDDAAIATAGSLQNATSAACSEVFAAFKAAAAEGVRPTQEFMVATEDRDGQTITSYTCVATDTL